MSEILPSSRPSTRRVRYAFAAALVLAVPCALAWALLPRAVEHDLLAVVGCVVVLVGFAAAYAVSALLIDLPSGIVDTVRRIADGELGHRVGVPVAGRLRPLAESFNAMVDHLETTQLLLEKSNIALEQRAAQLQREVTVRRNMETGLLAAIEAAEAADVAKSEFLTNISHELRTPMTVIISSTELLLQEATKPDDRQFLEIIKQSSDSMLALINNLIDFSRTERGELALDVAPFCLRDNVRACIAPFAAAAADKGLSLACTIDPKIPDALMADVGRFRQALANLVSNAIKFTRNGGIRVELSEYGRQNNRLCLHAAVHDTGIGIPAPMHDVVFEPFTQVDGSSTREQGGTGLGLALTRQIIELMDGRVWLESEPGRGTVFHFLVQMVIAGGECDRPPVETELEPTSAGDA